MASIPERASEQLPEAAQLPSRLAMLYDPHAIQIPGVRFWHTGDFAMAKRIFLTILLLSFITVGQN